MKATAKIIGAYVRARAMAGGAGVATQAYGIPLNIGVTAEPTDRKNLYKPIRVKPEEAMRVMKIMEAAFESDRVGAPVELNDVGVIDPQ